jgi:mRNA interferase MazF
VQENSFNASRIATTIVAVVTSNTQLAEHPGNVFLPSAASGLPKDSAVNVSQLVTIDKSALMGLIATLPAHLLNEIDAGLRMVLAV